MKRALTLAALAGALSGCATEPIKAAPGGPDASLPADAPLALALPDGDGPQLNSYGGEIPRAAPTTAVGEGALDEAEPG